MSGRRKCIILVSILVVLLIAISVIIYVCGNDKSMDVLLIGNGKENVYEDEKNDDNLSDEVVNDIEDNTLNNDEVVDDIEDNTLNNDEIEKVNVDADNSSVDNKCYEEDVVEYFSLMEEEVNESSSFKEKFKEYFITVVDFIFYDKEIKGYSFSELSSTAKAKIISFALKIDSKIEEYVPGYKESISSTSSKIYTNIKEKLVTLYMDISTDICRDNEEECTKIKDIFNDIKDACSIGWDFICGLLSSGGSKIKEWYEIYSGK